MSPPDFAGRHREIGLLRSAFDRPEGSVIHVRALSGMGKSALVRRAAGLRPLVEITVPPLPDPLQRRTALEVVRKYVPAPPHGEWSDLPSWADLFGALRHHAREGSGPAVLLLEDAHRLSEARTRLDTALGEAVARPGAGPGVHVVLAGPGPGLPLPGQRAAWGVTVSLALAPLPFRAASTFLPGRGVVERLRAYSVFGGSPRRLRTLDRGASLATNVGRLLLDPDGPLAAEGLTVLERHLQTPSRYAATLRALAGGEAEWSTIHAGVPDLTTSGQVGPYLARLTELGLVEPRNSLDAGPRTRSRRYRLTDPFFGFWYRFVLPARSREPEPVPDRGWSARIQPELDAHVESILPAVAREYMTFDAMERLGVNARECGSLWGPEVELPVAGMLASGPAFYGSVHWERPPGVGDVEALGRQIRETRYGFGRERRLRILFSRLAFPAALQRRAAARDDVVLVPLDALEG